jgi:hypothetical protein
MGATGQNLGHLFIDEGFVACDAFNLDKVNVVLKGMMDYGGYESIMLMSHLDTIRSAADMVIDIERVGMFSYIRPTQPGNIPVLVTVENVPTCVDKEVPVTVVPVKRRGRPKKSD